MDKLIQEISIEKEYIEQTINFLTIALEKQKKSVIELFAMASFLHHSYTGMENILKRILSFRKIDIPSTSSSHKDLLTLAVDKHIISQKLSDKLDKYRGFRHFFVHSYGVLLEEEELLPLPKIYLSYGINFIKKLTKFTRQDRSALDQSSRFLPRMNANQHKYSLTGRCFLQVFIGVHSRLQLPIRHDQNNLYLNHAIRDTYSRRIG